MLIWIKYKYSGYDIGFDSCSEFSFTDGAVSLFLELICVHLYILIIKKDILIVGEGTKQKINDDTTLTAEAKYPMNFTQLRKRFVLSLQYKGRVSYLLMQQKYINSRQKTLK